MMFISNKMCIKTLLFLVQSNLSFVIRITHFFFYHQTHVTPIFRSRSGYKESTAQAHKGPKAIVQFLSTAVKLSSVAIN